MTTQLVVPGVAFARINWGRPIVDCPSPSCTSALLLPPGTPVFECWDCRAAGDIAWPDNLIDIALVLAQRPDEKTRNWAPGETLVDLLVENAMHGITPPSAGSLNGRTPLVIQGDQIVSGRAALGGT